ncbi:MAG: hypothetical protein J0651_02840, partial [Actinobacteria bacterium]|nr:hypothetical protein [Actinomycetota bacterium]
MALISTEMLSALIPLLGRLAGDCGGTKGLSLKDASLDSCGTSLLSFATRTTRSRRICTKQTRRNTIEIVGVMQLSR